MILQGRTKYIYSHDDENLFEVYKLEEFSNLHTFLKIINPVDFVFRGQSKSDWILETSINRNNSHSSNIFDSFGSSYKEKLFLKEFEKNIDNYENISNIDKSNSLEVMSSIQHYGGTTRLLDFTKSLFIALFFAVEGSFDEDGAIWAINKKYLFQNDAVNVFKDALNGNFEPNRISVMEGEDVHGYKNENINDGNSCKVYLINPLKNNKRLQSQQGCFLFPTNTRFSFFKNLVSTININQGDLADNSINYILKDIKKNEKITNIKNLKNNKIPIIKLIIPKDLKQKNGFKNLLDQMNVKRTTLFPDFEGFMSSFRG